MDNLKDHPYQFLLYTDASVDGANTYGGIAGLLVEASTKKVQWEFSEKIDFQSACTLHAELTALSMSLTRCFPGTHVCVFMDCIPAIWVLTETKIISPVNVSKLSRMCGEKESRRRKKLALALEREGHLLDIISTSIGKKELSLQIDWVKGHGVDPYNLRVDRLAGIARKNLTEVA